MAPSRSIIVVGSGVVGLTCAVKIQERLPDCSIKIVAAILARDPQSIEYTSSWAGAHNVPVVDDPLQAELETETFREVWELANNNPELPLMIVPCTTYYDKAPREGLGKALLRRYMPDYRELEASELPEGVVEGHTFKTVTFSTPDYLVHLADRFERAGGIFERRKLGNISEVLPAEVVINCTGLGARNLGGVEDASVYPIRGQTVLVRAPWVKMSFGRSQFSDADVLYVIPRKDGNVVCGGTTNVNDWSAEPRPETSKRIRKGVLKLCPELLPEAKRAKGDINDLDVVKDGCGLRPGRHGGIRLERGADLDGKTPLIHAYGHAGAGYQSSLGTANRVVQLVLNALQTS